MQWFRNLKIGPRLALGFATLIVFGLVGSGLAIQRIHAIEALAEQMGTEDAELLVLTQQWSRAIESNVARTWVAFYVTEPGINARVKDEMKAVTVASTARLKRITEMVAQDPEALAMVAQISRQRDEYQALRNGLLKRKEAGENVDKDLNERFYPIAQAYLAAIDKVADYQRGRSA